MTYYHHQIKRGYLENKRGNDRFYEDMFNDIEDYKKHLHQGFKLLGILPEPDDNDNNPERIGFKIFFSCECAEYE